MSDPEAQVVTEACRTQQLRQAEYIFRAWVLYLVVQQAQLISVFSTLSDQFLSAACPQRPTYAPCRHVDFARICIFLAHLYCNAFKVLLRSAHFFGHGINPEDYHSYHLNPLCCDRVCPPNPACLEAINAYPDYLKAFHPQSYSPRPIHPLVGIPFPTAPSANPAQHSPLSISSTSGSPPVPPNSSQSLKLPPLPLPPLTCNDINPVTGVEWDDDYDGDGVTSSAPKPPLLPAPIHSWWSNQSAPATFDTAAAAAKPITSAFASATIAAAAAVSEPIAPVTTAAPPAPTSSTFVPGPSPANEPADASDRGIKRKVLDWNLETEEEEVIDLVSDEEPDLNQVCSAVVAHDAEGNNLSFLTILPTSVYKRWSGKTSALCPTCGDCVLTKRPKTDIEGLVVC